MRFPFFASFIVFIIWLTYQLIRIGRLEEKQEKDFWCREAMANRTRRKSLEDLAFIQIPFASLADGLPTDNEKIRDCMDTLQSLSTLKIVNLTGWSNTDLKLRYGAPNITLLMEYDQNYTLLARTLQCLGSLLYENGHEQKAREILEFAVSTHTDVSGSYKLLADIYQKEGHPEKIRELLQIAEELRSVMKGPIVRNLQEFCQ